MVYLKLVKLSDLGNQVLALWHQVTHYTYISLLKGSLFENGTEL